MPSAMDCSEPRSSCELGCCSWSSAGDASGEPEKRRATVRLPWPRCILAAVLHAMKQARPSACEEKSCRRVVTFAPGCQGSCSGCSGALAGGPLCTKRIVTPTPCCRSFGERSTAAGEEPGTPS